MRTVLKIFVIIQLVVLNCTSIYGQALLLQSFFELDINNLWVGEGFSYTTAGDVNNDGYDDVILGVYNNQTSADDFGYAYIYYGGSSMDNIVDVSIIHDTDNRNISFGGSVAAAGDVNNDGYDDVIIGAQLKNQAYIYYGGSSMDTSADVILTGEEMGGLFGRVVSTAGDVNNDGYDDVIIGTQFKNQAYIYYGGTSMDNNADVILTGDASFGSVVSAVCDVNNDGFDDIAVGDIQHERVYVYYGGQSMDNNADIILKGERKDLFGISVSTAGDVNNDEYDDIIIGASLKTKLIYIMVEALWTLMLMLF